MHDVNVIDPVEAKAFEIRRFALNLREKISTIDDIDRLEELESVLIGAKHRLQQLREDVIEAERTRVLVLQRIGVLLGPARTGRPKGPQPELATPLVQRRDSYRARLLAEYPAIVDAEVNTARVRLSSVVTACRTARAVEKAEADRHKLDEEASNAPKVHVGQWWKLGPHTLYCGDSTDDAFVARVRAAEPVFAFADPTPDVWAHDYLATCASVVAATPNVGALERFIVNTDMPYQWAMAAWTVNDTTRGATGVNNWIPILLYAREASAIRKDARDFLKIAIDPTALPDSIHPHRKPIRLMLKLIELFTSGGDVIVDPFLGSGTTLHAADKLKRVCIGADFDPLHCGEIIARWGDKASLITS